MPSAAKVSEICTIICYNNKNRKENMFIQEVKLNKQHWSFKLLKFTFPGIKRFNNFCPHFWLTVIAIFILIPNLLIRGIWRILGVIKKPFEWIVDSIINKIDKIQENAIFNLSEQEQLLAVYCNSIDIPSRLDLCERKKIYRLLKIYWRNSSAICDKFDVTSNRKYFINQPNLSSDELKAQAILDKMIKESDEQRNKRLQHLKAITKKREKRQEHFKVKKDKAIPILMFLGKYIIMPSLILIAAYLVGYLFYILFFFFGWLWYWISFFFQNNWIEFLTVTGYIILMCGILVLLVLGLITTVNSVGDMKGCKFCAFLGRMISFPFKYLWVISSSLFSFIWVGLKTFKSSNCPGIVWTEDLDKQK